MEAVTTEVVEEAIMEVVEDMIEEEVDEVVEDTIEGDGVEVEDMIITGVVEVMMEAEEEVEEGVVGMMGDGGGGGRGGASDRGRGGGPPSRGGGGGDRGGYMGATGPHAAIHHEWDPACKVWIGGLGDEGTRLEIEDAFGKVGPVKNIWLAKNPPGFAFVEMEVNNIPFIVN